MKLVAEVLAGHPLEVTRTQPVAVALDGVVGAVHPVRHPPGVGLDAHDPQLRDAVEHASEDERADHVLAAPDDAEEAVHLRPAEVGCAERCRHHP